MLGCVGAPGAPLFRLRQHLFDSGSATIAVRNGTQQPNVSRWKRVRLPQLTQGNVLRRPFPDTAYRAEPLDGFLQAEVRSKQAGARDNCRGNRRQRCCPARWHPQGCQVRSHK